MSNHYPPANFAQEAIKEIRRRECRTEESLEDSELEEIINCYFKQSICDNCELRMLFDANERVSKELYNSLKNIISGIDTGIKVKKLIEKYKNLES